MKSIKNYLLFTIGLFCLTQTPLYCAGAAAEPSTITAPQLLDSSDIKELIDIAKRLHDTYPPEEYIIYGLGNSPAYLIETLKILYPNEKQFNHIAFSGDWWGINTQNYHDISYTSRIHIWFDQYRDLRELFPKEGTKPSPDQVENYRKYLTSINLTPQRILDNDRKIVIIDMVHFGGGLKSFTEFIKKWVEEQGESETIKQKLHFHIFNTFFPRFIPQTRREKPYCMIFDTWKDITYSEEELPNSIRKCANCLDQYDRITQQFQSYLWACGIDPLTFEPQSRAKITLQNIYNYIQESKAREPQDRIKQVIAYTVGSALTISAVTYAYKHPTRVKRFLKCLYRKL